MINAIYVFVTVVNVVFLTSIFIILVVVVRGTKLSFKDNCPGFASFFYRYAFRHLQNGLRRGPLKWIWPEHFMHQLVEISTYAKVFHCLGE